MSSCTKPRNIFKTVAALLAVVLAAAVLSAVQPTAAHAATASDSQTKPVDGPFTFTSVLYAAEDEDTDKVALYWGFYNGERVFVTVDGDTNGMESLVNTTVQMHGEMIDNKFHVYVSGIDELSADVTANTSTVVSGSKTMAVLLVNFTDSPTPPETQAQVNSEYFGATGSVAAAYQMQSNGLLNLSGVVSNYLSIGIAASAGCANDNWSNAADAAAASAGITVSNYDYVSYEFNMTSNPCGSYSGLGSMPGRYSWIYGLGSANRSLVAHEWGHNLGLGHANALNCVDGNGSPTSFSSSCTEVAYMDEMSTMGIGQSNILALMNAVHRNKLGWLSGSSVTSVSSNSTVTLNKLYSNTGTEVAKIVRPSGQYLWVEYRTPTGAFDTQQPGGVMFHNDLASGNVTDELGNTTQRRGMTAGQSFYDYLSGATVTITSTTSTTATLNISFGTPSSTPVTTPPAASPTTPTNSASTSTDGYRLLASNGRVATYGSSDSYGDAVGRVSGGAVSVVATKTNAGYWVATSSGQVFPFGDATSYGSMAGQSLNQPIINMAVTPSGNGYWLLAKDGGVFAFGDAGFYGSTGNMKLNKPAVGLTPTASGHGYWFVASDGGVFAYGDAAFYGSMGGSRLNKPVSGMTVTPNGGGYRMVASDGGVFSFGNAPFYGSLGSNPPSSAIQAMQPTRSNAGYYMVSSAGGVYAFGDAAYFGGGLNDTVAISY